MSVFHRYLWEMLMFIWPTSFRMVSFNRPIITIANANKQKKMWTTTKQRQKTHFDLLLGTHHRGHYHSTKQESWCWWAVCGENTEIERYQRITSQCIVLSIFITCNEAKNANTSCARARCTHFINMDLKCDSRLIYIQIRRLVRIKSVRHFQ